LGSMAFGLYRWDLVRSDESWDMPRTSRACLGGYCYHVLNRGNARAEVFHKPGDYEAFLQAVNEASVRLPMPLFAFCLMPNHFHMVVRPHGDSDLSRWMQWLMTTHVRRYLKHYAHSGHVWQGRFKAFPIQDDNHLITVVRYVERNPLRAGLVSCAEDWPWSSIGEFHLPADARPQIATCDLLRHGEWRDYVNSPMTDAEAEAVRLCIRRNRPYGTDGWTRNTAARLGLESSLRSRGGQRQLSKDLAQTT
jgi:putative transposase